MSWWGKLAGGAFGFMLGGPLGAMLGAVLGHNLDKGLTGFKEQEELDPGDRERVQTVFFTATFSIMGHLAKTDGRVSEREIAVARAVMNQMELSQEMRSAAMRLFNQGKARDFPLDEVVEQFRRECHRRRTLIQMFIEIQLQAAYADGSINPVEERLLINICKKLGFPEFLFRGLERMIQAEIHIAGQGSASRSRGTPVSAGPSLGDAYAILNVTRDATDSEVKKAYRRQLSQHHPDKLVAKGLPEEMMKMAATKTHEIRQAYEVVKASRGW